MIYLMSPWAKITKNCSTVKITWKNRKLWRDLLVIEVGL